MADTLPSADARLVVRTQLLDLGRSVPLGLLYSLEASVLLTIAIKRFDASALTKGIIAASGGVGLLAAPVVTAFARRLPNRTMTVAATISLGGAAGFFLAAAGSELTLVIGGMAGIAAVQLAIPLMTQVYEQNYPAAQRGRRVGWAMSVKVIASAVSGLAMGTALAAATDNWRWVILSGATASLTMALLQSRIPSASLSRVEGRRNRPWPHFELLRNDRQLRLVLSAWMVMGLGNLMLQPLRVEYLAGDTYGIRADAAVITLLTITVPSLTRLVLMPFFGALFDRIEFFTARILVNLLFASYVALFFTSTSQAGLVAGAVAYGFAAAAGELIWNLWVIKFAPPGRVTDYMGLHAFFTGIRAVAAPLIGFGIVSRYPLSWVVIAGFLMMMISSVMLLPEARSAQLERRALST